MHAGAHLTGRGCLRLELLHMQVEGVLGGCGCCSHQPVPPPYCSLSEATKRMAARRILSRVSEAYGRMLLLDGLFQVFV